MASMALFVPNSQPPAYDAASVSAHKIHKSWLSLYEICVFFVLSVDISVNLVDRSGLLGFVYLDGSEN